MNVVPNSLLVQRPTLNAQHPTSNPNAPRLRPSAPQPFRAGPIIALPDYRARPLKRVIQQRIENPLAQRILKGEFADNDTIRIDIDKARHDFTFTKSAGGAREPELVRNA